MKRKRFRNGTVTFGVVSVGQYRIHGGISDDVFLRENLPNSRRNKKSSNDNEDPLDVGRRNSLRIINDISQWSRRLPFSSMVMTSNDKSQWSRRLSFSSMMMTSNDNKSMVQETLIFFDGDNE